MRSTLNKKNSTKTERIFHEVLKSLRIPFRHRVMIDGREIDFLLPDKVCIEIDGHEQDWLKNHKLIKAGYTPIHLTNKQIINDKNLKDYVDKLIR